MTDDPSDDLQLAANLLDRLLTETDHSETRAQDFGRHALQTFVRSVQKGSVKSRRELLKTFLTVRYICISIICPVFGVSHGGRELPLFHDQRLLDTTFMRFKMCLCSALRDQYLKVSCLSIQPHAVSSWSYFLEVLVRLFII